MSTAVDRDGEEIQRRMLEYEHWYHRIELAPGIVTPGVMDSQDALAVLDALGLPPCLEGLRALDVGCQDGAFTFALEQRGARVVAIDYVEPGASGFVLARSILGSQAEYRTLNVYDVSPESLGRFDIVLFLGVLYHLRNPLLAFDRIHSVCEVGALLFVETQLSTSQTVQALQEPLFQLYPHDTLYGDATNKWAPNISGLQAIVEESQFRVERSLQRGDRGWCQGRAIENDRLEFHRRLDSSTGLWHRGGTGGR